MAGMEGGHGKRRNTVKNGKKGGGIAAPERASNTHKTLMSQLNCHTKIYLYINLKNLD